MKNWILLFILFVSLVSNVVSQEFNASVAVGFVASQLDGDRYEGYNKAGIYGGLFVNRFITKNTAFQIGLRYQQKGSKRADTKNNYYYKSLLNYVELPLSVRYSFSKKWDAEAGTSLGYLINAKEDKDGNGLLTAFPEFFKFEFSGLLGLNFHWTEKIALGAQFNYSITAVRTYSSGYEAFMDKGQHNNLVCFYLVYAFTTWK